MDIDLDLDLKSIQEARTLVKQARKAFLTLKEFKQEKIDQIIKVMAEAGQQHAERLAKMAVEETGFGVVADKITKNLVASKMVYEYIKDMKTAGIIAEHTERKVYEIAEPFGIIAAIVPSTNPTATVIFKSLIAIKSRNAIIFSPHPAAARCTLEAAKVMAEAAQAMGAPAGVISCLSYGTMDGLDTLLRHREIDLILATGGASMVKSAYSTGKPAYGVGPGNVPAFIERTADIRQAVADIMVSKTFDNGTICASEQAIVTEKVIKDKVLEELRLAGGYLLNQEEKKKIEGILAKPNGGLNAAVVGKTPQRIAAMAGFNVPADIKVLIAEETGVGKAYPFSMEKLSPLLAFYTAEDWVSGCERCLEILNYGGMGHSLAIHSRNESVIMEFALKKPVCRILVNTPSTQGAIGYTTGLAPSLTLGCGSWGKNSTGDNITPLHLITIKRMAYGLAETRSKTNTEDISEDTVKLVVRRVLEMIVK